MSSKKQDQDILTVLKAMGYDVNRMSERQKSQLISEIKKASMEIFDIDDNDFFEDIDDELDLNYNIPKNRYLN